MDLMNFKEHLELNIRHGSPKEAEEALTNSAAGRYTRQHKR